MKKKVLFSSLLISSILLLNSCSSTNLNTINLNNASQKITAQSYSTANAVINTKIDKLMSAKRTFNNARPIMYIDGQDAYSNMLRVMDEAKKSLYVETFIFHNDESGLAVANKLIEKKKQGLDVKVLVDGLGLKLKKDDSKVYEKLKNSGVDIQIYNKLLVGIHGINITHRKVIIADGETALTGGMNFGVEYEKIWHDSMTEIRGEVAQDLQKEFFIDWVRADGKMPKTISTLPVNKNYGNTPIRVVVTSAHEQDKRYQIRDSLMTLIDNSKTRILMEGAYFSDDDLINALIRASKRGVDVNIIIPEKGDSKIYDKLNLYSAKQMLKEKVNVFFYQPRFAHMKASIIDDFVVVGSANPDARSFRENQELNVIIENTEFRSDLELKLITKDMYQSNIENLKSVEVSFPKKVVQSVLELIDYYL